MKPIVSLCLAIIFVCGLQVPVTGQDTPPLTYEIGENCRIEDCPPSAASVRVPVTCGFLTVPESRERRDSRNIELAILIAHTDQTLAETPVVALGGGPGNPLLEPAFAQLSSSDAELLVQTRDWIFVEQRGVGYSRPVLGCDEPIDFAEPGALEAGTRACHDEFLSDGVDLTAYSTPSNVEDVEDLRLALGISEWNVYGVSYGTKWAMSYAKTYPDAVRALVLDGILPLSLLNGSGVEGLLFTPQVAAIVDSLLAECAADAACNEAYPDLSNRLRETIVRLNANPVEIAGNLIDGEEFAAIVTGFTGANAFRAQVPRLIHTFANENYLFYSTLSTLGSFGGSTVGVFDQGTRNSVVCRENAIEGFPSYTAESDVFQAALSRSSVVSALVTACEYWQSGEADLSEYEPLISDLPVLMLQAEHDVSTPPSNGYLVAETLSNATIVDFPNTGHVVLQTGSCPIALIDQFLETLDGASLNTDCIAEQLSSLDPFAATSDDEAAFDTRSIQQILDEEVAADDGVPGQIFTVSAPSVDVNWSYASGVVDVETGEALLPTDTFRIASITKTFVAAAVLRLFEQGRVDLDTSIEAYLSSTSLELLQRDGYATSNITVRQLLTHTSGIADFAQTDAYVMMVFSEPGHRWTREAQLTYAIDYADPLFAPGAGYAYSDTGYILLGEILEERTGENLGVAVRQLLGFEELELTATYWEILESPPSAQRQARQYVNGIDITRSLHPSVDLFGGGGLISSTSDLAVFFRALLNGDVFERPETLEIMLSPATTNDASAGMGIFRYRFAEQVCWGHTGVWGVFAFYCPQEDVAIVRSVHQASSDLLFTSPIHERVVSQIVQING